MQPHSTFPLTHSQARGATEPPDPARLHELYDLLQLASAD